MTRINITYIHSKDWLSVRESIVVSLGSLHLFQVRNFYKTLEFCQCYYYISGWGCWVDSLFPSWVILVSGGLGCNGDPSENRAQRFLKAHPEVTIRKEIDYWVVGSCRFGKHGWYRAKQWRDILGATRSSIERHDGIRGPANQEARYHDGRHFCDFCFGHHNFQRWFSIDPPDFDRVHRHPLYSSIHQCIGRYVDYYWGKEEQSKDGVNVRGICNVCRLPPNGARRVAALGNVGRPSKQREDTPEKSKSPQGRYHRYHDLIGDVRHVRASDRQISLDCYCRMMNDSREPEACRDERVEDTTGSTEWPGLRHISSHSYRVCHDRHQPISNWDAQDE